VTVLIRISEDFTDAPGGRHRADGEWSGEEFREDFLESHMGSPVGEEIVVDLDRTFGYATSFLEEAFGGLARVFGSQAVLSRLRFISTEDPELIERINTYISHSHE